MKRLLPWMALVVVACGAIAAVSTLRGRRDALPEFPADPPAPAADAAPAWSGDRPNVVLVIGCTVRRDQLSPYGGHPATTPFLSEVAANGVLFSDAIASAPWTKAAAASLVSGRPFREIGMFERQVHASNLRLAEQVDTIAEAFHEAGYFTVGATANPNLNRVFGFAQGFDVYEQTTALWRFGMKKLPGEAVVDRVLPLIDARVTRDAPVYAQIMLLDAHHPRNSYHVDPSAFGNDVPTEVLVYRAFLNRFDGAVHRLWRGLRERGFDDTNTVFVVVSDHGEGLYMPPNQGKAHGINLAPSVLQMTWLVRGRGVPSGRTVDGLASQVDVFPTLVGLAGLDAPSDVAGRDWSAQIRDGSRTDRTRAYAETDFNRADKSGIYSDERACELRYRNAIPERGCFDRKADPFHTRALPATDRELMRELEEWRARQKAAADAWAWAGEALPSSEEKEMLEQLGYVDEE